MWLTHFLTALRGKRKPAHDITARMAQARAVQKYGYDIGFKFLPRFPDVPHIAMCSGRYMRTDGLGSGYSPISRTDAFTSCLYETVERALWIEQVAYWKDGSVHASARDIQEPALSIEKIAGFSAEQRAQYNLGTPDEPLLWSRGFSIATQDPLLIPAQLISSRYAHSRNAKEPLLRESNSNGLASHENKESALCSGIWELFERDAFMITFHNRISAPTIPHTLITKTETRNLLKDAARYDMQISFVLLPTDMAAHVVMSVVRDKRGGPAFAVGAKAHAHIEDAVYGALVESFGVWLLARHANKYTEKLPPFAEMRALDRIAYWAQGNNCEELDWLTNGAPLTHFPKTVHPTTSTALAKDALGMGVQLAAARISTPLFENIGFHVYHVVSPELQPLNLDAHLPYLGGSRLRDVARNLGYSSKDMPPPYPHPFP